MASPFPGMNPYLENPAFWSEVHGLLIAAIANNLNPLLRPKYRVAIEQRVYQNTGEDSLLVGIPDVGVQVSQQVSQTATNSETSNIAVVTPEVQALKVNIPMPEIVKESYLEVRDINTREVVTVIEILSPKNKRSGEGRNTYEKKRLQVLGSLSHLVEIDLLREGKPMTILPKEVPSDYRILVSNSEHRPKADLYAFNLQNKIPSFSLPLRNKDVEPLLDLQTLINELYDRASFDLVIDYSQQPVPPLSKESTAWLTEILQDKGLR
jgi:Protein of unknown function (DUF4058)